MSSAMAGQALEILVASNIALIVGVAVVWVLRKPVRFLLGARLAYWLWLLPLIAVLGVLLPGPYGGAGPVTSPWAEVVATFPSVSPAATPVPEPALSTAASPASAGGEVRTGWSALSLLAPSVLLLLWLAGAVLTTGILLLRQWRFERLIRPLVQAPDLGEGVYRAVTGLVGAGLVGSLRPRIVVPVDFETRFNLVEQRLVLDHEREHQRAGHAQLNALAAIFQAVFWLNPVVHLALRAYRLDQELACDAAVLARTSHTPRTYGQALLRAQTGELAPLGCAWRPPGGLPTRLAQLSRRAPGTLGHVAGLFCLFLLFTLIGSASWAARPEGQVPGLVAVEAGQAAPMELHEVPAHEVVKLYGLDATLTVIAEDREIPVVEGLSDPIQSVRSGNERLWQVGERGTEVCDSSEPLSQRLVVRVPHGVSVHAQGRMDARVFSPRGGSMRFEGCGTVTLADVSGALDLSLAGSVALAGDNIEGDLILRSSQSARASFVELDGDLRLRTSGGARLDLEALNGSGTFSLSGGSVLSVERWDGPLLGSVAGGSELDIEEIWASKADFTVSGGARAFVEDGDIESLRIEQAAQARFAYGGAAVSSRVRNRGDSPVILAQAGELDSVGSISTRWVPPDG